MVAHTLSSDRLAIAIHRGAAAAGGFSVQRTEAADRNTDGVVAAPRVRIDELAVVLSPEESHRDVVSRAQLLAHDGPAARTALLLPPASKWHRFLRRIALPRSRASALGADASARVLLASLPSDRARVEDCPSIVDFIRRGSQAHLVVVGRRRFPWALAPLARPVRRLLRRTRTPVLVVGSGPAGAYRNVVIATDLETPIDSALAWARHIAPHASFTLLHVQRELESRLQWAGATRDGVSKRRLAALRQAAARMSQLLTRNRVLDRAVIACGPAVHDALRKTRELGADLIVVTRSTHSWWAEALGASVSVEIAKRADRDVLVVHGARSRKFGVPT